MNLSQEKIKLIFKNRAKKLAATTNLDAKQTVDQNQLKLVLIQVDKEIYAFDQSRVREVISLGPMTKLPGTPGFIAGIIYYRGQMITVNDLSQLFGLKKSKLSEDKKVVIISDGNLAMGILADSLIGTQTLSETEILDELSTMKDIQLELTIGLTPDGACLLSATNMLSHPKLILK